MEQELLEFSFEGLDRHSEAGAAASLNAYLADVLPELQPALKRAHADAQDMGTIVQLVLAAPVSAVLAKGLANWLSTLGKGEVTIKTADGAIIAKGLSCGATKEIVLQALSKLRS